MSSKCQQLLKPVKTDPAANRLRVPNPDPQGECSDGPSFPRSCGSALVSWCQGKGWWTWVRAEGLSVPWIGWGCTLANLEPTLRLWDWGAPVPSDGQLHKVCEQLQRQSTTLSQKHRLWHCRSQGLPSRRCVTGRPPSLWLLSCWSRSHGQPGSGPRLLQYFSLFRYNSCLLEATQGRPHTPEVQTLTCGVYGSDDYFHHSEEQAENQKVKGLPEVTELLSGRTAIWTESRKHKSCTLFPRCLWWVRAGGHPSSTATFSLLSAHSLNRMCFLSTHCVSPMGIVLNSEVNQTWILPSSSSQSIICHDCKGNA